MSFGRITPTELPIRVSLRAAMVGSNVITSVIIPRLFRGFKRPPELDRGLARPRIQYHPCNDPKEDPDATIPAVYARRPRQSHRSHPRPGVGEGDRRRIRGLRMPVMRPGLSRREDAAQTVR